MHALVRNVVLTVCAIAASGAPFAATLELEPACGGSGFAGTAQEGAVGVRFESCGAQDWCHVKVWKASGEELTESLNHGTKLSLWMGGILLGPTPMTDDQLAKVKAVMESPEADLMRCTFEPFREKKATLPAAAVFCFEVHGQGYEGKTKTACPSFSSSPEK
jgi:hypothetical protein